LHQHLAALYEGPPLVVNRDAFVNTARLHTFMNHLNAHGMTSTNTGGACGLNAALRSSLCGPFFTSVCDVHTHLRVHKHTWPWPQVVCVTGGTGFLGCAIVRHVLESKRFSRVIVVDMFVPAASSPRRITGAEYVQADLCSDDLVAAFDGVDVVVHTAGRVALYDDYALVHVHLRRLHASRKTHTTHAHTHTHTHTAITSLPSLQVFNAHVVATRRVVAAARRAGVRALLVTSSSGAVTTPYTPSSQLGVPSNFQPPPEFNFPTHYASTKYVVASIRSHQ
jgi:nucleoside-diphosphate-sugar epimerase